MRLITFTTALIGLPVALGLLIPALADRSSAPPAPEKIFSTLGLREGGTACEIGAGDGALAIAAAHHVGPQGRVFASELGEKRLRALREKVEGSGLTNITVVDGEIASTGFGTAACDAVFLRDVYHHITQPAEMNASIAAALKSSGRVAVVDFTPPNKEASDPSGRAKDGQHGVKPETVTREMEAAGLTTLDTDTGGTRWFMVVFEKRAE